VKFSFMEKTSSAKVFSDSQTSLVELKSKTGKDLISAGDKVYAIGNGINHGIGITEGLVSYLK